MKPVQLLLITGSAGVLLVYLGYFRSKLLDRLLGLSLLAVAWFGAELGDAFSVCRHGLLTAAQCRSLPAL